jgi:tetratricopeptide (TPR) repeat protein
MLSAQQDILKGDFDAALKSADAALARDPGYFDALIMKAQLLCWLGDERYRRFISKARKIDKRRTKSFMKNCWMEAAPDRHPAARLGERLARANELVVEGRLEEALAELAAIKKLETEPRIREVIEGISTECLIALKRTDEARRSVRKLLRANPENPHAHLYKAQLELFSNAPEQALGTIDECIRCAQKDKLEHFDYYLVKADILKRLGREYKEWEEKGDRLRQESLQKLKTEAKAAGLECKEQNGFITFE